MTASVGTARRRQDTSVRVHVDTYEKLRAAAEVEHKPLTQHMDDVAESPRS